MIALALNIMLDEPVLVSAPGGDPNTNLSLDYIPGSVIRGALINAYLKDQPSESQEFHDWFLSGKIRFLNGYPCVLGGRRSLPVPNALVEDKTLESGSQVLSIVNRLATKAPILPKSLQEHFGLIEQAILKTVAPPDQVAVHTMRDREMGKAGSPDEDMEGAVYQYQSLAAGIIFQGIILVPDGLASSVTKFESLLKSVPIWLGGATTGGYGKVHIKTNRLEGWREISEPAVEIKVGHEFNLLLTSDMLVRDAAGQFGDHVVAALIDRFGEGAISQVDAYNRLGWVGGFNRKWGLPLPQEWVVSSGGSYRLKANRTITQEEVIALETDGLGERRAEGFGQVVIAQDFARLFLKEAVSQDRTELTPQGELSDSDQKLIKQMVKRWLTAQLDRGVAARINDLMPEVSSRIKIRNSQLARLRIQLREAARKKSMKPIKDYLNLVNQRAVARDQYESVHIHGERLLSWVEHWIEASENAEFEKSIWKELTVDELKSYSIGTIPGGKAWQTDSELQYEYTLRLIDGVLARLMKQGDQE